MTSKSQHKPDEGDRASVLKIIIGIDTSNNRPLNIIQKETFIYLNLLQIIFLETLLNPFYELCCVTLTVTA